MKYLTVEENRAVILFTELVRQALGENLILMKLFGSKARGDYNSESDIDILIIVKERNWDLHYNICGIANDLALELGAEISPIILTEEEFNKNRDHNTLFYKNVEKEGQPV